MAMCSYVERRRERYYFRARLPVQAVAMLGRTHVVGSLLTSDPRVAKIRASRFYFVLAGFLNMLVLRMRDDAIRSEMLDTRTTVLVQKAFELGRRYEAQQDRLRRQYDVELQAMMRGVQREWENKVEAPDPILLNPLYGVSKARAFSELEQLPRVPAMVQGRRSPAWHTLREAFLADKPGLAEKTLWSYNQAFEIWKSLIGDKSIAEMRRTDVKLFADHLRDRPNSRGGRLNYQSIDRSLRHIKNFMAWAVEAGHVEDDRFKEVKGRDRNREERLANDGRRAFTDAELEQLLTDPLFRCPECEAEQAGAWFLLIAALTGARTEEITQAPADLVRLGDVWCLDLRHVGTKTRAAPRLVPLLPDLIRLGLPAWAKRQATSGRRLVQPGPRYRCAAAWSKYLNRFIDRRVTDASDLVLYSLRHTFRQMLRAANLSDELANKVFGHETGTVGAGYGRQLSQHEAELVVRSVRPPLDLRFLKPLA